MPWTKCRRPFHRVYYEACGSKDDAVVKERYRKSGMGKCSIRNRLKNFWKVYPVRGLGALLGDGKNVSGPQFALGLAGLRQSAPK